MAARPWPRARAFWAPVSETTLSSTTRQSPCVCRRLSHHRRRSDFPRPLQSVLPYSGCCSCPGPGLRRTDGRRAAPPWWFSSTGIDGRRDSPVSVMSWSGRRADLRPWPRWSDATATRIRRSATGGSTKRPPTAQTVTMAAVDTVACGHHCRYYLRVDVTLTAVIGQGTNDNIENAYVKRNAKQKAKNKNKNKTYKKSEIKRSCVILKIIVFCNAMILYYYYIVIKPTDLIGRRSHSVER